MILDDRKIYYVYEWYNIDTGEIFYVGKGRGLRCQHRAPGNRNKKFVNYVNKNNCTYRKVFENLDEETACGLEDKRIKELKSKGQCICNLTDRTSHRGCSYGKDNGFYGKKHTASSLRKMSEANLNGRNAGENNSQYGISPLQRMGKEKYDSWRKNHSKTVSGEGNSQSGVSPKERMSSEVYSQWLIKQSTSKFGKQNPKARPIILKNENCEIKFDLIKDCVLYLKEQGYVGQDRSIRGGITKSLKLGKPYKGMNFEYVDSSNKNKR